MEPLTALAASAPFWTAVGVLALALLFKKPLSDRIGKANKLGPGGIEVPERSEQPTGPTSQTTAIAIATAAAEPQQASTALQVEPSASAVAAADLVLARFQDPWIVSQDEQVRSALEGLGLAQSNDQALRVAIRLAGFNWVISDFERVYAFIFGTQVQFLRHLNAYSSLTDDEVRAQYASLTASNEAFYESFPFERWIGFLRSQAMITFVEGQAQPWSITDKGRSFLKFLINFQKLDPRI